MFEVSWGELIVLGGLGVAVVGRRDLPRVANTLGVQVGRVVGLLQGARARADRFAAAEELKQLQNELRSGLRELDAVRTELATSMAPTGMVGRNLGALTSNVNRTGTREQLADGISSTSVSVANPTVSSSISSNTSDKNQYLAHGAETPSDSTNTIQSTSYQSIAAVAEQEWGNRGISFQSAAEQRGEDDSGSTRLADLLQQSLIFDQYDRTVQEQDAILRSKIDDKLAQNAQKGNNRKKR